VDDGRGAGSLKDAGRTVRVMNQMSEDEAAAAQVKPKDRKRYFRVDDDAKSNMQAPAESADWFKLISVPLYNDPDVPNAPGDSVGVVVKWALPGVFAGIAAGDLPKVQAKIHSGVWAHNVQASDWAGRGVAEVLDLDITDGAVKERVKRLLAGLIESKALKLVWRLGPQRRDRPEIIVDQWVEGGPPSDADNA
jgi:hypothetical protein